MKTLASFARCCAAALIAAPLAVGTAGPAFAHQPAAPTAAIPHMHGAWQGFSTTLDGHQLFGAVAEMGDGTTAAVIVRAHGLAMFVTNPKWCLRTGVTVPVRLTIDGTAYSGTALVANDRLIELQGVSAELLKTLAGGHRASLDVNQGDLVWQLDLDGFTQSMSDAARLSGIDV